MKQKTQSRTGRWMDRVQPAELLSPYPDAPPPVTEPRVTSRAVGLGPYESSYDISLGYSHDRSIVVP